MATAARRAARRRNRQRKSQQNAQKPRPNKRPNRGKQKGLIGDFLKPLIPAPFRPIVDIGEGLVGGLIPGLFGAKGQHAAVAGAGRSRSAQINASHEHGMEEITTIHVPAGTPAGTILLQSLIAAPEVGVRLSSFSRLWSKTHFRNFAVIVTSSNPTTVSGNYTLAIDPDPVQTYASGPELPARLMALTVASRANAWADNAVQMAQNMIPLFNKFNVASASDAELREYACGQLIMATTTEYSQDCDYTVTVQWDVTFERPDTQPADGTGSQPTNRMTFNLIDAPYTVVNTATPNEWILTMTVADFQSRSNLLPPRALVLTTTGLVFRLKTLNNATTVNVETLENLGTEVQFKLFSTQSLEEALPLRILQQTPPVYSIDVPVGRLVESGFAKVHRLADTAKHAKWYAQAIKSQVDRREKQALDEAIVADLKEMHLERLRKARARNEPPKDAPMAPPDGSPEYPTL